MKLQTYRPVTDLQLYQKETSTQLFSCEYCEVFKNTYFEEHLRTADSGQISLQRLRKFK